MFLFTGKFAVIFPIVAFLLNNFVGAYVYAKHNNNRVNRTFLLFTLNSAGWLGFEFLLYLPISHGYETEVWRWSSLFWIFSGVLYLEFAYALAGKKRDWLVGLGIGTALIGYAFTGFTDKVFVGVMHFDWGTAPACNVFNHTLTSANTAIFTTFGVIVLVKKRFTTDDDTQRKIITLILQGTVVSAAVIALVNVILPNFLGIMYVPRYGAAATAVFMVLVFYAIVKYRFLAISPHEVAEEIYEGVKVGILLLAPDDIVIRANREAGLLLGEGILGYHSSELFVGNDVSGEYVGREVEMSLRGERRTYVLSASRVIHGSQVLGTILMVQDITSQKDAEKVLRQSHDELEREIEKRTIQLRRAQRMETIGTLAGGIAHDFNNSLAAILGFSKAALMDLPEADPIRQDLHEVILAANRGKDMVHQIMTLARKENKADYKVVNMTSLIDETVKLAQVSTPEHIQVVTRTETVNPHVNGAPTQLSQVIMNLYTNACQAMKGMASGKLTITLKNRQIGESREADVSALRPGAYVCLTLSDSGVGIAKKNLPHIFDPFFTTKARDEGTGLGLSSVQVIVHNHEGEITVTSREGEGTTFSVYLPVFDDEEARSSAPPPRPSDVGIAAWDEEILWVDDKPQILRMGKRMMSQLGYKISTAEGGYEALELFKQAPDRFSLVITDYSMPRITGTELAEALRKIRPDVPVIIVSGYGDAISQEELSAGGVNAFLHKPLEARELSKTIREVLDSAM
ncbi:MAG: response regulator [Deltaproteobacteria bacterium]|nr:response regulator [Deltaproteobacteria bacterium]MBN2670761.1 response regulator [Deltaproteobacteria bacterium]